MRELGEVAQLLGEHRLADGGELVRPAAVDRGQGLDEAARLEPGERGVQGSGAHGLAGPGLDVGHDRVAVLRPVAQADEDQERGLGEPAEFGIRGWSMVSTLTWTIYRGT